MMLGRPDEALKAAEGMEKVIPAELTLSQPEFVDPFFSIKGDIYKRFGMWEEILAMPEPRKELVLTKAMWHFNRGVALANVGKVDDAETELAKLIEIRAKLPASRIVVISPADQMLEVAQKMLEGEMAYKRGELEVAISLLKEAVSAEDKLLYMEPPEWLQPVRHTLGAVLLEAGKAAEAEEVYLADLKKWPENAWSLKGLASAQERLGKTAEAVATNKRFEEAWRDAEVEMNASCKCVN
jgi:tetratricopeptide (TPR) repeat protein